MTRSEEAVLKVLAKRPVKEAKVTISGPNLSRTFLLRDTEGNQFRLFLRKSDAFPENFSVGLELVREDGDLPLVRLNGRHGGTIQNPHHADFHAHLPRWVGEERPGSTLSAVESEGRYASLDEALTMLVRDWTIEGMEAFFPALGQGELAFDP